MPQLLFAFIFNYFILLITVGAVITIYYPYSWYSYAIPFAILMVFALIGYSPIGCKILVLFMDRRKASNREIKQLKPILNDVLDRYNALYKGNYKIDEINIHIQESHELNAMALGYNNIIVTTGLYKTATDEQIHAVLAHEFAHLHYKDSVYNCSLMYINLINKVVLKIAYLLFDIWQFIMALLACIPIAGVVFILIMYLGYLFLFPFVLLNKLGDIGINLITNWNGRTVEYRADSLAGKLGYKKGLIEFLEIIESMQITKHSWWQRLQQSHPPTMFRIDRLDRLED